MYLKSMLDFNLVFIILVSLTFVLSPIFLITIPSTGTLLATSFSSSNVLALLMIKESFLFKVLISIYGSPKSISRSVAIRLETTEL